MKKPLKILLHGKTMQLTKSLKSMVKKNGIVALHYAYVKQSVIMCLKCDHVSLTKEIIGFFFCNNGLMLHLNNKITYVKGKGHNPRKRRFYPRKEGVHPRKERLHPRKKVPNPWKKEFYPRKKGQSTEGGPKSPEEETPIGSLRFFIFYRV